MTGDLNVPDEVYGVSWNGSMEVPTKNAVYDKIQTIGGGGSITGTEIEIDFGSLPISEKTFTITDANVSPTSLLIITPSGETATGRVGNDSEWDGLICTGLAATGSFTLSVVATGSVVDKRKINYIIV